MALDLSDPDKMYMVTNSLDLFITGGIDFSDTSGNTNMRVIR